MVLLAASPRSQDRPASPAPAPLAGGGAMPRRGERQWSPLTRTEGGPRRPRAAPEATARATTATASTGAAAPRRRRRSSGPSGAGSCSSCRSSSPSSSLPYREQIAAIEEQG